MTDVENVPYNRRLSTASKKQTNLFNMSINLSALHGGENVIISLR